RRPLAPARGDPRLSVRTGELAALAAEARGVRDVYLALGTTIKVAGSEAAFRAVDFDLVVGVARAARAAGATRLAVVSALGANARSGIFYNRVKGEAEDALKTLGYESLVIAQPSLLIGDRSALGQPTRSGELFAARFFGPVMSWIPAGVRPIEAKTVARAMVAALEQSTAGTRVLSSAEMQRLGR
ncbi:MAG TPA: nucleoside-diphosphate sugar epimerase, partial [Caldimonas sp.]|nr:nucleoside-diphosphate sugar epimerase [Caldimonas sp.]